MRPVGQFLVVTAAGFGQMVEIGRAAQRGSDRLGPRLPTISRPAPARPTRRAEPRAPRPTTPAVTELDRFARLSAAERERHLAGLPPEQRTRFEDRLRTYQRLSPHERDKLARQLSTFEQLPPSQQQQIRQAYEQLQALPPARQHALQSELGKLRKLPADRQTTRLSGNDAAQRFSPAELEILRKLAALPLD